MVLLYLEIHEIIVNFLHVQPFAVKQYIIYPKTFPIIYANTVGCDTCKSGRYFDGCNDCICDGNGNPICTLKFCFTQSEPFCRPDCSAVFCLLNPVCNEDEFSITPAGECCPKCVKDPDCSNERCIIPNCGANETVVIKPGECCGTCVPALCEETQLDCIGCDSCETGEYFDGCNDCTCDENGKATCTERACLILDEPFCVPNCTDQLPCAIPVCLPGFDFAEAPPGECCPTCVPSLVVTF